MPNSYHALIPWVLCCALAAVSCSDDDTEPVDEGIEVRLGGTDGRIYDTEFERRKYFFLFDPNSEPLPPNGRIRGEDLVVWVHTNDLEGDRQAGRDIAWGILSLEGDGLAPEDLPVTPIARHVANDDYFFVTSERSAFPHLVMRNSISPDYSLAVSYRVRHRDTNAVLQDVGNYFTRTPGDTLLQLKMVQPERSLLLTEDLTLGPWAPTRNLQMKNIYSLGARNIDITSLVLNVRRVGTGDSADVNGITYLEIVGLDLLDNNTGLAGSDGKVDQRYIDTNNGLLYFPDSRPFAPSLADLEGIPGIRPPSLPEPRRRALGYRRIPDASRPGGYRFEPLPPDSAAEETNALIYDRRDPEENRKYFVEGSYRTHVSSGPALTDP